MRATAVGHSRISYRSATTRHDPQQPDHTYYDGGDLSPYSLESLIETLEGHDGDQHLLEFTTGRRFAVIDRQRAEQANPEILDQYGIPRDRKL